jgi:imidazolonepropionase
VVWDQLWTDVRIATGETIGEELTVIEDGALGVLADRIVYVGPASGLPGPTATLARTHYAGDGRLLTAGLIDCHTHLVFGGDRSLDFDLRTRGMSYAEIAGQGGGIRSTVAMTRALSVEALATAALPRARALIDSGVTTIEVKSGYGLDLETELKMLEVAHVLSQTLDVGIVPTFLALHALPPAYAERREAYVDEVVTEWIPAVAKQGLAHAVDVFLETIAFTREECARALGAARAAGLEVKVHADQLSNQEGAALAAQFAALSADHLEYTTKRGVKALAKKGSVAVLLPGAFLMTGEKRRPPVEALREAGVPIAVATDLNPGTSPITSLPLAATLARATFGLTATEAFLGITRHAARALGLADRGHLAVGQRADFCLWDAHHPRELSYWLGKATASAIVRGGRLKLPEEHPLPRTLDRALVDARALEPRHN